jgi:uncharacterized damage-inducible protein DinB
MLSGFDDLLDYTDWQRGQWLEWLHRNDPLALEISAGPGGDGRFETVRDLIKHVFSAEKRYIDRLSNLPITDPATIPSADVDQLFAFGKQSRIGFRDYLRTIAPDQADITIELMLLNKPVSVTPRKVLNHVLLHEIRHWAQIATLLRLNGFKMDSQDFIFSPVHCLPSGVANPGRSRLSAG